MSGIAAIYHRDGQPVDPTALEKMVKAMSHRGPDGLARWANGPVALGHCLMQTTPESLNERYPVSDGRYRLVWDGRLDNRQELLRELKSAGVPRGAETDPELALGAYQVWGERCAAKLLGEFAVVIWDERQRLLFGARDRLGLKPLYYASTGSTLLIASEQKALFKVLDHTPDPDDEMLLAVLLAECREPDNHRSLFAGIHRLPPGHVMMVTDGQLRIERYWQLDPSKQTVYKRPEAYVEHFLALFHEAVRCRTRSAFPLGCFLSGGLDSSAIAAVAATSGATVEAFTGFSPDDPASDERGYAQELCQAAGIPLREFCSRRHNPLRELDALLWTVECPLVGTNRDAQAFLELIRSRDCRIVLDGEGADQLLDEGGYLADVLLHQGPGSFLRETRRFAQWHDLPTGEFARAALRGMMPSPVKWWGKRLLRRIPPPWINQELARSVGLAARIRQPRVPHAFPFLCQTFSYQEALSPYTLLKLELTERHAAWGGQEIWYPYLDSRLVEFVLSIPWHQRCHDGERKWLLRQAMKGVLPQRICQRQGKGDWTNEMDQALLSLCRCEPPEPLANRSEMVERYLSLRGAKRMVEQYLKGERSLRWEVWSLVTLDRWLNRFWRGGEDVTDTTIHQEAVHFTEAALLR